MKKMRIITLLIAVLMTISFLVISVSAMSGKPQEPTDPKTMLSPTGVKTMPIISGYRPTLSAIHGFICRH